ncbi:MAG: hypothetical protein RIE86_09295 [Imperialibacter sp.]|uniref:hypothetical protein n=1 Tax=Imperialibacter sp. TaxID=2038411 RepID=UPI0032EEA976
MKTLIFSGSLSLFCALAIAIILLTSILWFVIYAALTHDNYLRAYCAQFGVDYDRLDDDDYWNGFGNWPTGQSLDGHDFTYPIIARKEGVNG